MFCFCVSQLEVLVVRDSADVFVFLLASVSNSVEDLLLARVFVIMFSGIGHAYYIEYRISLLLLSDKWLISWLSKYTDTHTDTHK